MLNHDQARQILLGLSETPSREDKRAAMDAVMSLRSVADTQTLVIPLVGNRSVQMMFPQPMTEQDWEMITSVLAAVRPGLVVSDLENPDA